MNIKQKKQFFLIRWHSDREETIIDGYQLEALRHSEKKWYNGEPQFDVLRTATKEEFLAQEAAQLC